MNPKYPPSRPFFTWRIVVAVFAGAILGFLGGVLAVRFIQGVLA